jgi:opacity protein-like surface antigen
MIDSRVAATLLSLITALPVTARADGAFLLKLGAAQLQDTSQEFNGPRKLENTSNLAYGALIEHRFPKIGLGVGVEYVFYRHRYTPPANPEGTAEARVIMLSARKYFMYEKNFRPYVGGGVGGGEIFVKDSLYRDSELAFGFQAVAGAEWRIDNLSLNLEAKYVVPGNLGGNNEYYPDAIGLFAGVGFNW